MSFNFSQEYILENDYVLLRPLKEEDFTFLRTFSINEPELWIYSLSQANSEESLKQYINIALKAREGERQYPFIVYDKINKEYAGSTRFYDIQLSSSSLQLGYTYYGKKFQRTGLNRRCKFLLLEFAFETIGLERVEFRADNENKRSIEAMKKIGCTVEGVLRNNEYKANGARRDSIVLSILRNEWLNSLKDELLVKCKF